MSLITIGLLAVCIVLMMVVIWQKNCLHMYRTLLNEVFLKVDSMKFYQARADVRLWRLAEKVKYADLQYSVFHSITFDEFIRANPNPEYRGKSSAEVDRLLSQNFYWVNRDFVSFFDHLLTVSPIFKLKLKGRDWRKYASVPFEEESRTAS